MTTIRWDETGTPVATRFDDPYYSKRDGRAEAQHVFINGNRLPERFAANAHIHVAELGFGTGLNFFETLTHWDAHKVRGASLSYTSFELFPLTTDDITRALSPWPTLEAIGELWRDDIPRQPGWHTITRGDVTLRLAIGDANEMIDTMQNIVDAWFLDGFSPAKNPELWNESLMQKVGLKTSATGTFTTYTAAGWVRRMMEDAGFEVERIEGYGTKRHMSVGRRRAENEA
ncbi:MAG: tRNA (5-methylaminomethyl-2-thiouridine)(34)-methyltransferase MnmD [Pseudomonadota bacterium]